MAEMTITLTTMNMETTTIDEHNNNDKTTSKTVTLPTMPVDQGQIFLTRNPLLSG